MISKKSLSMTGYDVTLEFLVFNTSRNSRKPDSATTLYKVEYFNYQKLSL